MRVTIQNPEPSTTLSLRAGASTALRTASATRGRRTSHRLRQSFDGQIGNKF